MQTTRDVVASRRKRTGLLAHQDQSRWPDHPPVLQIGHHGRPVCRRCPVMSATARWRIACAAKAWRGHRPGTSDRAGWRAHAHDRLWLPRLDEFLGPAGHGQDYGSPGCLRGKPRSAFEQISAIFSGVADSRKSSNPPAPRRMGGRQTLLFVDEIHPLQPRPAG